MADKKLTIMLDTEQLAVLDQLSAYRGVPKRTILSQMITFYAESFAEDVKAAEEFLEKRKAMKGGG